MANTISILAPCWTRLKDCHSFWHEADGHYNDPEMFRRAIQSFITTLRTVTFVLQAQKREFPDFDSWYSAKQAEMAADPVLRWLVESRNTIEKQGDLATNSTVRVELIASYLESDYLVLDNQDNCLFASFASLMSQASQKLAGNNFIDEGMFRLSRRWVADSCPNEELLALCNHGYRAIHQLLSDGELVLGNMVEMTKCSQFDASIPYCMSLAADGKSAYYKVSTLEEISVQTKKVQLSPDKIAAFEAHYVADERNSLIEAGFKTLIQEESDDWIHKFFEDAVKPVFLRDEGHHHMLWAFKGHLPISFNRVVFDDKTSKYLILAEASKEILATGCDGVAFVGESWSTRYERDSKVFKSRKEVLNLTYLNKAGLRVALASEILRASDASPSLGETEEMSLFQANMFSVFCKEWKLPIENNEP